MILDQELRKIYEEYTLKNSNKINNIISSFRPEVELREINKTKMELLFDIFKAGFRAYEEIQKERRCENCKHYRYRDMFYEDVCNLDDIMQEPDYFCADFKSKKERGINVTA